MTGKLPGEEVVMSPCCPHCGGERVPSGERARCKSCGQVLGLEPRRLDTESQVEQPLPHQPGGRRPLAFGAAEHIS